MSKLGVHIVQGPRTGYGDFLRRCAKAGQPVAVVKAVDDSAPLAEAKSYSDQTITIYRTTAFGDTPPGNWSGDPIEVAQSWMARLVPHWRQHGADYYEPINEPDPDSLEGYMWLNLFTERCIEIAEANGFKLALYSFAAGVPEIAEFARLVPSLKRARRGGHILSLHEYGIPGPMRTAYPALVTRYREYYAQIMIPSECIIPVVITEAAPNGGHDWGGLDFFLGEVTWYDVELMRDPYVIGVTLFTLGSWANANFADALPRLADWIVDHPTTPVELPPPPPPPLSQKWFWIGVGDSAIRETLVVLFDQLGIKVQTADTYRTAGFSKESGLP